LRAQANDALILPVNARKDLRPHGNALSEDEAAWCGLRQTYLLVTRGLDAELRAVHRLPLGEFELLRALTHPGCAQRMAGLADAVGLSPSGLTRAIERLETRGLVQRVACPDDRRGAMAELSEAGKALLMAASVTHDAVLHHLLLDHLSAADSAHLLRLWQRLAGGEAAGCPGDEGTDSASHQREQSDCSHAHDGPEGDTQRT
jgi:DNA-binding MarR family transcriptional regulator